MVTAKVPEGLKLMMLAKDARSHYDAYVELSKNKQKLFTDFSSPAFMCLSFSLELHIKLLLRVHGIEKRGHEILKLVKVLPQTEIDLLSTSEHIYPWDRGQNFIPNLYVISGFFMRVRYYFEDMGPMTLDPWFSIGVIKAIQDRVAVLTPRLKYDLGLLR